MKTNCDCHTTSAPEGWFKCDCENSKPNNMSRKIIGFKLIKEYPNITKLGKTLQFHEVNNSYLINWPEFWEPIYEESIDLETILNNEASNTDALFSHVGKRVVNRAMKEACKQTLELAAQLVEEKTTYEDDPDDPENARHVEICPHEIRNLINKIQ